MRDRAVALPEPAHVSRRVLETTITPPAAVFRALTCFVCGRRAGGDTRGWPARGWESMAGCMGSGARRRRAAEEGEAAAGSGPLESVRRRATLAVLSLGLEVVVARARVPCAVAWEGSTPKNGWGSRANPPPALPSENPSIPPPRSPSAASAQHTVLSFACADRTAAVPPFRRW